MKTRKIIQLTLILVALIMSCSEQPYWDYPKDENGEAVITQVSKTTTAGITALDPGFSGESYLPNTKAGDVMTVELVKPQVPSWNPGGATQILPIAGTKKTFTVDNNLKIAFTYTRAEATMTKVNDWVTVIISGETESGIIKQLTLTSAMSATKPKAGGKEVVIVRSPEVANMEVKVTPKSAAYTGDLTVKTKNGAKGAWITTTVSVPQPYNVPVAGTDFTASDTMFYEFTATSGQHSETVKTSIVVVEPYFLLHKKGITLTLGGSSAGLNLLTNTAVAANNANAVIAVVAEPSGALALQAGSAYAGTIEFVPSTEAKFIDNKSEVAKADFAAGTPATKADPSQGEGAYIFKIVSGSDTYYGMLKVTSVVPGKSVSMDYKIGDKYAHLAVIQ
jgi:hypothetical protein